MSSQPIKTPTPRRLLLVGMIALVAAGAIATYGLISRAGVIPIAHSQDTIGPIARTVTDAAALLGALHADVGRELISMRLAAKSAMPSIAAEILQCRE